MTSETRELNERVARLLGWVWDEHAKEWRRRSEYSKACPDYVTGHTRVGELIDALMRSDILDCWLMSECAVEAVTTTVENFRPGFRLHEMGWREALCRLLLEVREDNADAAEGGNDQ